MRKALLTCCAILCATPALAGGHETPVTQAPVTNVTNNNTTYKPTANAWSNSTSRAASQAAANAASRSNASANPTSNASANPNSNSSIGGNNGGNNGNVSSNSVGFTLPSFAGSGECTPVGIGPGGFGGSGGGGGLITWESTNCNKRQVARLLMSQGKFDAANYVLATIDSDISMALYGTKSPPSPPQIVQASAAIPLRLEQAQAQRTDAVVMATGHDIDLCVAPAGYTRRERAELTKRYGCH